MILESKALETLVLANIDSTSYVICCKVNYSLCKAEPPWPHSCDHLLDGIAMKIIMWFIGSVASILNIFSLIASIYKIIKSLQFERMFVFQNQQQIWK